MHKKFIKRGDRKFGPYYYTTYRDGDKIKTRYFGKEKFAPSPSNKFNVFLVLFVIIAVSGVFLFLQQEITGKVISLEKELFFEDEVISGNFEIPIKEGELIPDDSVIRLNAAGKTNSDLKEIFLKEIVNLQEKEGNLFYNGEDYGYGKGFGFKGEKVVYPSVNFKLRLIPIAGMPAAVMEISGSCSAENPFVYGFDGNVELVSGSVYSEGKQISDNVVAVIKGKSQIIVTTEYKTVEKGFGKDFIGAQKSLNIDISQLKMKLPADDYSLEAELTYNDGMLFSSESKVFVVAAEPLMPVAEPPILIQATVSDCGDLNNANTVYYLQNDVNSSGTCFNITANNVTLDCQGYMINYSRVSGGYGVNITGYNSTTIKNCIIVQGNPSITFSHGIYLLSLNSTIINNNISTGNGAGVYLDLGSGNNLTSNNLTSSSWQGIYIQQSSNNTITANHVHSSGSQAIYLNSGSYNTLISNNITTVGTYSIGFYSNSHYNNLISNYIKGAYGIQVSSSSNNTFNHTLIKPTDDSQQLYFETANSFGNNMTNTTFATLNSSVRFPENIEMLVPVKIAGLNITYNKIYLNSTNLSFLNTSAQLTFQNIDLTNPQPIVDFDDDGDFEICSPPQCNEISYNSTAQIFVFNVSSFTTYSSNESGPPAPLDTNVSYCRTLNNPNTVYTLNQSINSSGTCITIDANNITLDCDDYVINYSQSALGFGIQIISYDNITVKNCNIVLGNNSIGPGARGMLIKSSGRSLIANNTITINSSSYRCDGIMLETGNNNIIIENIISTYSGNSSSNSHRGIFMYINSSHNNITNNNITTTASSSHGIFFLSSTWASYNDMRDNLVYGNVINTKGSGAFGIQFYPTIAGFGNNNMSSNTITANNITTEGSGGYGILISGSAGSNNSLTENVISENRINTTGSGSHCIYFTEDTGLNNTVANNSVKSNFIIARGSESKSIYLSGAHNNTFFNNDLLTNQFNGSYIFTNNAFGNNMTNTTFAAANGSIRFPEEIEIPNSTDVSTAKLNITYNKAFLNSTNLSFLNTSAQLTFQNIDLTNPQPIVDFDDDGDFEICSPPQCNEISYNSTAQIFVFNVSSFTTYSSQETPVYEMNISSCQNLDAENMTYYLNQSVNSSGTCFNIIANNITLDCQGNSIDYANSETGYGIFGGYRDKGEGIAVDSNDNVIVAGHSNSFDGSYDVWTIKYNSTGSLIWNKTAGGDGEDYGYGVAVDSNDNVIVAGHSNSFGGDYDVWTIKYNSTGSLIWNKTIGGSGEDYGYGVAVDSNDDIIVVGTKGNDVWTIKYNSTGSLIWNKTIGGSGEDYGYGVAIDSNDNVIVAGYTNSFGEDYDVWTIKYNSAGNLIWDKIFDWGGEDYEKDVAVDSNDNIIVIGYTDLGEEDYSAVLAIKFDPNGYPLIIGTIGGNEDYGHGITVDSNDNLIMTGSMSVYDASGIISDDAWTMKYNSTGSLIWQRTAGGLGGDYGKDVAVDSNDSVIITGFTEDDVWTLRYNSSGSLNWSNTIDIDKDISLITIKNCDIIQDNAAIADAASIYFLSMQNSTIINNTFSISSDFWPISFFSSSGNNITGNNIVGADGIELWSSSNNHFIDNNISGTYDGIKLELSSNNIFTENNISAGDMGVSLRSSSSNNFTGNDFYGYYGLGEGDGIELLSNSNSNIFRNNKLDVAEEGVVLYSSSSNIFEGNNITANYSVAFNVLFGSSNNTLLNNELRSNYGYIQANESAGNNMTNTTFAAANESILFPDEIEIPANKTVDIENLNLTFNKVYLSSPDLSFMNKSAVITFKDLNFLIQGNLSWEPKVIVDFNDDSVYERCYAPQCNEISWNNVTKVFVFNVSSFTSYKSAKNLPLIWIINPVDYLGEPDDEGLTEAFATLPIGTVATWINITTSENATCQYSSSPFDFGNGTDFTNTGTKEHSFYTSLSTGLNEFLYKCNTTDGEGRTSYAAEHEITVASAPAPSPGGGGGARRCIESWNCSGWSGCINGWKTRTCIDLNECGTVLNKPDEAQKCCVENWQCTDWSECINERKTRTCTDLNECGTVVNKPAEIKACKIHREKPVPSPWEEIWDKIKWPLFLTLLFLTALLLSLIIFKRKSEEEVALLNLIERTKKAIESKKLKEGIESYKKMKEAYVKLPLKKKKKYYQRIMGLHKEISKQIFAKI